MKTYALKTKYGHYVKSTRPGNRNMLVELTYDQYDAQTWASVSDLATALHDCIVDHNKTSGVVKGGISTRLTVVELVDKIEKPKYQEVEI
jgi:hypothetical protein